MMKPVVYVETSVVSYLTARQSRDVVVAAYQEITREWWRVAADRFDLVASALVVSEARAGDTEAARSRLMGRLRPFGLSRHRKMQRVLLNNYSNSGRFHEKRPTTLRT